MAGATWVIRIYLIYKKKKKLRRVFVSDGGDGAILIRARMVLPLMTPKYPPPSRRLRGGATIVGDGEWILLLSFLDIL
jgi:hypothetical protein